MSPQRSWTKKQERQYQHIRKQSIERGSSVERAEEIAARTVNKERARSGHAKQAGAVSTRDRSAYERGGRRSGKRLGPGGRTKRQLYEDAKRQNLKGRSRMNKAELEKALKR
ncbi:MAG: plasmid stabilization protein [Stackebrandtia sp.]